jgi:hypothetical protein
MLILRRIASAIHQRRLLTVVYEFLLIFFAVLGGMWAENWREDLAERSRVKQHLLAMVRDLESDSLTLARYDTITNRATQHLDNLIENLNRNNSPTQRVKFYIESRLVYSVARQIPDIRRSTYDELEQAGDMRLLAANGLKQSISDHYTSYATNSENQRAIFPLNIIAYLDAAKPIFNAQIFHRIRKSYDLNIFSSSQVGSYTVDSTVVGSKAEYLPFSDVELQRFKHAAHFLYGHLKGNQSFLSQSVARGRRLRQQLLAAHAAM